MHRGFLAIACAWPIAACTDDIGLPAGTADLAIESQGSANLAWASEGAASWSLFFGSGSSAPSCAADASATVIAQVELRIGSALTPGEYTTACGSNAGCATISVSDDQVDWGEVELLDADANFLRGSLEGSATTGSDSATAFYGSFEAIVCAP